MVSEKRGELRFAFQRGDAIELGLQGRDAFLLDSIGVHAGGVEVADLLLVGSPLCAARSSLVQHDLKLVLGVLGDHGPGAEAGAVIRNGIKLGELPASELEEIDAW